MKIRATLTIAAILIAVWAQSSAAYAQNGQYITIYDSDIYIPEYGYANINISPAPYSYKVNCSGASYSYNIGFSIFVGTSEIGGGWCANSGDTVVDSTREGASILVRVGGNGNSGTVHIRIEGYNQVNDTVNTTPQPTSTPLPATSTPVPTSTVTGGTGGGSCGTDATTPCYVVNATPDSGSGGSGGSFNAQTPVTIGNFPTPLATRTALPTTTPIHAIQTAVAAADNPPAVQPVVGVYQGPLNMMPSEVASNNDNYTAAINGEVWDFGCPIDTGARGITTKICIKYEYISSLTLIGISLPIGIIIQGMLVLVVVYIIKTR